jgi:hypothetical protein
MHSVEWGQHLTNCYLNEKSGEKCPPFDTSPQERGDAAGATHAEPSQSRFAAAAFTVNLACHLYLARISLGRLNELRLPPCMRFRELSLSSCAICEGGLRLVEEGLTRGQDSERRRLAQDFCACIAHFLTHPPATAISFLFLGGCCTWIYAPTHNSSNEIQTES